MPDGGAAAASPRGGDRARRPLRAAPAPARPERVGLVLPTSLCAAQIARLAAERLNAERRAARTASRASSRSRTPKAAASAANRCIHCCSAPIAATSPIPTSPRRCCSNTAARKCPNDVMRRAARARRPAARALRLGQRAARRRHRSRDRPRPAVVRRPAAPLPAAARELRLGALTLGVLSAVAPEPPVASSLAALVDRRAGRRRHRADAGRRSAASPTRRSGPRCSVTSPRGVTLAYGQPVALAGLHLVQTDTDHWVENVTGLAACGAHLVVGAVGDGPQQGHPLIAVLQVAGPGGRATMSEDDVDFVARPAAPARPAGSSIWCWRRRGATWSRRRRRPDSSSSSSPAACSACRRSHVGARRRRGGLLVGDPQVCCGRGECQVGRPQFRPRHESGRQQMGVCPADSSAIQLAIVHEGDDFGVRVPEARGRYDS